MSLNSAPIDPKKIAKMIDHTLLKLEAKEAEIIELCRQAMEYGFYSVCIRANWLKVACATLKGSSVLPITVVGFPSGSEATSQKVRETKEAIVSGAREIDMVLNRKLLKSHDYLSVVSDIREVVQAAQGMPVKVILETCELTDEEKIISCALVKAGGALFVKTSTGFSTGGATEHDVKLLRRWVGSDYGVKASGGIRTWEDAVKMVRAGASRLGTSQSVMIVQGKAGTGSY